MRNRWRKPAPLAPEEFSVVAFMEHRDEHSKPVLYLPPHILIASLTSNHRRQTTNRIIDAVQGTGGIEVDIIDAAPTSNNRTLKVESQPLLDLQAKIHAAALQRDTTVNPTGELHVTIGEDELHTPGALSVTELAVVGEVCGGLAVYKVISLESTHETAA